MSCYVVSDEHICAIVSFASKVRLRYGSGQNSLTLSETKNLDKVCKILKDHNVESFNSRYDGKYSNEVTPGIVFNGDFKDLHAMQIIKLVDSLSCECRHHTDFTNSAAEHFLENVKDAAIRRLPGYNDFSDII